MALPLIRILRDTPNCIAFEMPAGKPNPHEKCPEPEEIDRRSRVFQSAQKGLSCFQYALNYLRPRYGKKVDKDSSFPLIEGRFFELACSKKRKNQLPQAYLNVMRGLSVSSGPEDLEERYEKTKKSFNVFGQVFENFKKEKIPLDENKKKLRDIQIKLYKEGVDTLNQLQESMRFVMPEKTREVLDVLENTLDSLYVYLETFEQEKVQVVSKGLLGSLMDFPIGSDEERIAKDLKEFAKGDINKINDFFVKQLATFEIKANQDFLQECGLNLYELMKRNSQAASGISSLEEDMSEWKSLFNSYNQEEQARLLNHLVNQVMAEKWNLKKSQWVPSDPIEALIETLRKEGPLLTSGRLGKSYYETRPLIQYRKIKQRRVAALGTRNILGWSRGAKRLDHENISHTVVIVGAEKIKTQQLVYFIDPTDSSNPKDPSMQAIYALSYKRFTQEMDDLNGKRLKEGERSRVGWAYHATWPQLQEENSIEQGMEKLVLEKMKP